MCVNYSTNEVRNRLEPSLSPSASWALQGPEEYKTTKASGPDSKNKHKCQWKREKTLIVCLSTALRYSHKWYSSFSLQKSIFVKIIFFFQKYFLLFCKHNLSFNLSNKPPSSVTHPTNPPCICQTFSVYLPTKAY